LEGPLLKLSPNFMAGWQLRWFEVAGGRVKYYGSPEDAKAGKAPKGEVELLGFKVKSKSGTRFEITTASSGDRVFSLDADVTASVSSAGWDIGPCAPPAMQDWLVAFEQEAVLARRA